MTALIGYARVSKADGSQVHDLQRDALAQAGVEANNVYEDAASGKKEDRPGLVACLKALRRGDTLVVWKLDRLGRDLRHLVNLVDDLTQRHIGLKVLAGEGASIDTSTANGRLVFGIFAALAEFERALIIERTKAGLAAARARGVGQVLGGVEGGGGFHFRLPLRTPLSPPEGLTPLRGLGPPGRPFPRMGGPSPPLPRMP